MRRVDSFIRALADAERAAGFEPTRADNAIVRARLWKLFALVGDLGDNAMWAARVKHAVETRKAKGSGDCAWIWMGDDERASLRIDQLASGPVWNVARDAGAVEDYDGLARIEAIERAAGRLK